MKLEITKENAIKAHSEADSQVKELLENLFGKQVFIPAKITDRVKTFEDACKILCVDSDNYLDVDDELSKDFNSISAYMKLIVIARALNEGWEPNWNNSQEYKYYPWFEMGASGSGFGLSNDGYGYSRSSSRVGSRLCFKSAELAKYAGEQFIDLYNDYLTI